MTTISAASIVETARPYAALITDAGLKRQGSSNADAVGYAEVHGSGLYIVADGVGTNPSSKQASHIAVEKLKEYYLSRSPAEVTDDSLTSVLKAGFDEANTAILSASTAEVQGSTTLVAALIDQSGRACFANVGDSRAYILRGGRLQQVTIDHSWTEEQVRTGKITRAEAASHPRESKIIYRSVGKYPQLETDLFVEQLQPGDTILLCSDGLYRMVAKWVGEGDDTAVAVNQCMVNIIGKYPPAQLNQAATELVRIANAAGGEDNISVVLVRMPSPSDKIVAAGEVATVVGKPHAHRNLWLLAISGVLAVLLAAIGVLMATSKDNPGTTPTTVAVSKSPTEVSSIPVRPARPVRPVSTDPVIIVFNTPGATPTGSFTPLPAPRIIAPQQGSVFQGIDTTVVLSWEDNTPLSQGEDYVVRFRFSGGTVGNTGAEAKERGTSYTMSTDYYNEASIIYWQVQREKDGVLVGDSSSTSYFSWLAPQVTPTRSATVAPVDTTTTRPTASVRSHPTKVPRPTVTPKPHPTSTVAKLVSPTATISLPTPTVELRPTAASTPLEPTATSTPSEPTATSTPSEPTATPMQPAPTTTSMPPEPTATSTLRPLDTATPSQPTTTSAPPRIGDQQSLTVERTTSDACETR